MSNTFVMPRIKAVENYRVKDGDIVTRGTAVANGLDGNPYYQNLPFPLADLRAGIDRLSALIVESLDGSKKVVVEKNKQREEVIRMLRLLAHYVEFHCKGDMAIFKSSGFEPVNTLKTPQQPVNQNINSIDHGPVSGQVVLRLKAVPKAIFHEVRCGVSVNGAIPTAWNTTPVTDLRSVTTIAGLIPGTTYAFQARSLSKGGYSDWSDSAMFMCT